nr:MAG TPA: hypothetical protein [Bacteriophage sp.]
MWILHKLTNYLLHYRIKRGNIHTSADNTNRRKHD